MSPRRADLRGILLPAGLCAIGALALVSRTLPHPGSLLVGDVDGDIYKHAWSFWHNLEILGEGTWPHTRWLAAPRGGAFFDVMLVPSLLMAPITWALGPVPAANLWILLNLWAVGLAVHGLARALGADRVGAATAALLAQGAPYLLGFPLTSGVLERLPVWLFPLAILAILRVRDGGRAGWALLACGGFAVTVHGCPAYGIFTAALLACLLPVLLASGPVPLRSRVLRVLPMLLALGLLAGGLFLLVRWQATLPDYLAESRSQVVHAGWGIQDYNTGADLGPMLLGRSRGAMGPLPTDTRVLRLVYLGWAVAIPALVGGILALRRRRWDGAAVVGVAFLFAILALGHFIRVGTTRVVNPPVWLLSWLVPAYGHGPSMWQQVAVFGALAPVGAALALGAVPSLRWRVALGAALLILANLEKALVLPVPGIPRAAPARVEGYGPIVRDPSGTVLDLPRVNFEGRTWDRLFLAQTLHRRPIPFGLNLGRVPWDLYPPVRIGRAVHWPAALACFRQEGIRWLAVHPGWFPEEGDRDKALLLVGDLLGPPVASDPDTLLWDLGTFRRAELADERCPGEAAALK